MRDPLEDAWMEWTRGQDDFDPRRKIAFRAGYEAREGQTVLRSEYDNAVEVGNAEKRGKEALAVQLELVDSAVGDPEHPRFSGPGVRERMHSIVEVVSMDSNERGTLLDEHDKEVARRALLKYAGDNLPGVHPGSIDKWLDKEYE